MRAVAPLRFAFHGLQMIAAYVAQMAPGGRVVVAALLQAADEMRRVQCVAYRLGQLRRGQPAFAGVDEESRALWQRHPGWQPLRRLIERLLVTYDWGEALVALNVCAKPVLDEVTMVELPAAARDRGDYLLGEIFFSLAADCRWHRAWTSALLAVAVADRPENAAAVERWSAAWKPAVDEAAAGLRALFAGDGPHAAAGRGGTAPEAAS
jgi:toluene monooxygenase system protein E